MLKFALGIGFVAAALLTCAPAADAAQKGIRAGHKPLRGVIYGNRRIGGYSYKYSGVIDTRRFVDPGRYGGPNSGGAIDHDFFWSRPTPPFGGDTPYLR